MTIKQQGGIFGRNPTFNNADVDNNLNVGNNLNVSNNLDVDGAITTDGLTVNATTTTFEGSGDQILQLRTTNSSADNRIYFGRPGEDTRGIIYFQHNGGKLRYDVDSNHIFTVTNASGFAMQRNVSFPSGYGIDFSATSGTGTSELFDDYEEGVWTPAISGTADTTYSTQYGWYTKVGNLVSVGFELTVNVEGTITGNAAILGLPFTSGASDSKSSGSLSYSASSGYSSVWQGIMVGNNQTLISIYVKSAAGASTFSLNGSDFFANGTQIIGQLTYKV